MCNKAVCIDPYSLEFVPGRLKTEEMCNKAVHREPSLHEKPYFPGSGISWKAQKD